tara:strand:- start:72 stop:614 length:543 start_codon:yes stop_codon:yes gene_type:complete
MSYKVVDNFLKEKDFIVLQTLFLSEEFAWYFNDAITYENNNKKELAKYNDTKVLNLKKFNDYFFTHLIYRHNEVQTNHDVWRVIQPLLEKIDTKAIIRIKTNCYLKEDKVVQHPWHTDYEFGQKGCLFCVNTNNGYTTIENGTKIKSVANRAIFLDTNKPHASSSVSDQDRRININLNYF